MKRAISLTLLMIFSSSASAAGGSWSADSTGATLNHKGVSVTSRPLSPSVGIPAGATIQDVVWRYQLLNPAPAGLAVQLCSPQRCFWLDSANGQSSALQGESAASPLTMTLQIPGKGVIYPPVRVVSQQVIVNYR